MSRILILSPHPDDESIGCGGTLLRHLDQGDEAQAVFLTSGEKGGHGRSETETLRLREGEARAAARVLGLRHLEFWQAPDGALRATRPLVQRLQQKVKQFRPSRVYVTHDGEMHSDHRGAVRLVRQALAGLAGTQPEVLMYEVWTPIQQMDEIVDISAWIERKLRAVRAYRSQCAVVGFAEAVRGLNRYRGEMHCWPEGEYAEVFSRLKL